MSLHIQGRNAQIGTRYNHRVGPLPPAGSEPCSPAILGAVPERREWLPEEITVPKGHLQNKPPLNLKLRLKIKQRVCLSLTAIKIRSYSI